MIKKILTITVKTVLVLLLFLTMINIGLVREENTIENAQIRDDITIGFNAIDSQVFDLNNRCNQLTLNDMNLARIIQDLGRKYDAEIKSLGEKGEQLREEFDISTIINTDVYVQDIDGAGAGTIIKKTENEMYILTCAHVVEGTYQVNKSGIPMKLTIGYSKTDSSGDIAGLILYGAEILKVDEEEDLALIKTSAVDNELLVAPIAKETPKKGDLVYSVGSPLGMIRTVSKGILSNIQENRYVSDNTTTFGNSGGGLYNGKGELIGVPANVFSYGESPESSLGLSITLETIKTFLDGEL